MITLHLHLFVAREHALQLSFYALSPIHQQDQLLLL